MKNKKFVEFKTSHTRFTITYTTLMFVVSNSFNIDKIAKWFYLGDTLDLSALIAFFLKPLDDQTAGDHAHCLQCRLDLLHLEI